MMTGHHKTVANTYNNGVLVGPTPHFEAIEPLSFTTNGVTYAPMSQESTAFTAMLTALSTTELASAKLSQTFSDILLGPANGGTSHDWQFPTTKVGLRVGTLSSAKKALVMAAIKTYVLDVDSVNAANILAQYQNQLDSTYIAYSGTTALTTKTDYVRIDGPGVWIEFTVQGGIILSGVHYHSIWRDHKRDFGGTGSTNGIYTSQVGSDTTVTLPITFQSTSAYKVNDNLVSINWQTAYELNNNHFEVEHSTDGKTFSSIASILSANNLQGSKYNYLHYSPQKGTNYYRIKSVSNDGTVQYSSIMRIYIESEVLIQVYPNPARDKLSVSQNLSGSNISYRMFDLRGRLVLSSTVANSSVFNIDVSQLNTGTYLLSLQTESQSTQTKFIKQ